MGSEVPVTYQSSYHYVAVDIFTNMEGKHEKNTFQDAHPMQQKVFKFHNVSKDVILGNKKAKKDGKRNTKRLPPDKIQRCIEESQEKMAQLILKQYIPIRQKCLPVVNSQTKKHMETISTRKVKKTLGSKSLQLKRNKNNNLEHSIPKKSPKDNEKPPGIRLVDISLLKEPECCPNISVDNVQETRENKDPSVTPECCVSASPALSNVGWPSSPVHTNQDNETPLDLSQKKKPPEQSIEEVFPLDLSKSNKNYESHQYNQTGEPPPLMLIQNAHSPISPQIVPSKTDLHSVCEINDLPARTSSQKHIITLDCSKELASTKQQAIGIPQILQLQPIQVVFTTNQVLQLDQAPTACHAQLFPSPPITPVSSNITTREKIKTNLNERSLSRQNSAVTASDLGTSAPTMVQPIQMVFTDGKFVQVLPSHNIQDNISNPKNEKEKKSSIHPGPSSIRIAKKPRKRKAPSNKYQASLTTLLEPLSIQPTQNSEGLAMINTYNSSNECIIGSNNNITSTNLYQNHNKPSSVSPNSMIKKNEMVTSNGGIFCTFKNINRMKSLKTNTKARRKRSKPDQSSATDTQ